MNLEQHKPQSPLRCAVNTQDKFIRRCRIITEQISEESMNVEGEFMTIDDMHQRGFTKLLISMLIAA